MAQQFTLYSPNGVPMVNRVVIGPAISTPNGWVDTTGQTIAAVGCVPHSVLLWQAKAQLEKMAKVGAGPTLLEDANAIVAAEGGALAQWWANGDSVARNSQTLAAMAPSIGINNGAALDMFFINAAKIAFS